MITITALINSRGLSSAGGDFALGRLGQSLCEDVFELANASEDRVEIAFHLSAISSLILTKPETDLISAI